MGTSQTSGGYFYSARNTAVYIASDCPYLYARSPTILRPGEDYIHPWNSHILSL